MLKVQPETSIDQRIRDEFDAVGGGMSTAAFARHCLDAGFWDADEVEALALRNIQSLIRKSLTKHDATALPFAGQTIEKDEDGAPIWRQRRFWSYETYELNIISRLTQSDTLLNEAANLSQECTARFGHSPMDPASRAA